jgi:hypothetical protein
VLGALRALEAEEVGHGRSRTRRYRKRRAQRAWFCVDAEVQRSTAR